ncbi:MAG TPA: hypothetical protein DEQ38_10340 [Elusimicrobia bacterium]|nr:MAG: hypothetical protein A2089_11900 [Elusimicrobia bacterium GWD2_63_28]HCC48494.1 hypothetical protein [Elusimicrobiota bacterium]
MPTLFSELLCKIRKDAGFPTAYRFYHDNGGAPVLKLSYRNYLLIEQGKVLPEAPRLGKLIVALRLTPRSDAASELAVAWLKTMAGEETFENVFKPALAQLKAQPAMSPMDKVAERALADKKFFLKPEHYQAIVATLETYLCFLATSNDTGAWTAADLAQRLSLEKAATAKALAVLAEAGLLKKAGKDRWKSPLAGALVEAPPLHTLDNSLKKIAEYNAKLLATAQVTWHRGGIVRMNEKDLRNLTPLMANNISAAKLYAVTGATDDSGIFFIEGKIIKLRKF